MIKIKQFDGEFRFLSNFYPSVVTLDGVWYPTVEHAFQAAKTLDFHRRWEISKLATPGMAKRAGRQVVLRPDWEQLVGDFQVKQLVMKELTFQKYARNPRLRHQLLATGNAELIEGNTWGDTYWGVCRGEGRNELGKILMHVRGALAE